MTDLETDRPPVPTPRPRSEGEHPGSPLGLAALVSLVVLAGMSGGWSLIVMIAAILAMIFLHELGHYLTARWAGMKVTEFFIGFGPRIWSFRRGETEYGIKPIPLGAYVKIVGMHNLDEYDPADADRTYLSKPYWRRLSVAVAGSTMHFMMAIVGLFSLFAFLGVPGGSITGAHWVVAEVSEDSPAAAAGVQSGDRILAVDGIEVDTFDEFTDAVRSRPGESVPVALERGGRPVALEVTLDEENPEGEHVGFFGVGPTLPPDETIGVVRAAGRTFTEFGSITRDVVGGLAQILSPSGLADLGSRVASGNDDGPAVSEGSRPTPSDEADRANRPVSVLGVAQIGSDLLETDLSQWLELFVLLNMFIGIFNLVPLLPLDGGHVAIATYEKIRSLLQGGREYHVDVAKLLPLTYAVVLVLIFLGVSTVYLDIADPIGG